MTLKDKQELKLAKLKWRNKMRQLYPNFTKKAWGLTSYRINHPQLFQ